MIRSRTKNCKSAFDTQYFPRRTVVHVSNKVHANACSTSDSKFGRMQVVPYPFHCSFEWDAENKGDSCHARLSLWSHPEKLQEMVELNQSPDIQRRREIRVLLRAVAACGAPLSFAHTITRRFAYTVTSGKGKKKVTTRHWEDVEVSFKRGVIRCAACFTDRISLVVSEWLRSSLRLIGLK